MANFDKFGKGGSGHMLKHFERAKDENGEYVKFGNRDIDLTQTHLNYNLAPERGNQYAFMMKRCSEVYCLKRKDVNVLGSWIVTAPETLADDKLQEFFAASYRILAKKYGEENVISAYVHMDESGRPHMHFAFVPIVYDKKKERYTVSAKQCVTRSELQQFHPWLEQELETALGYHVDILNEATKDGNQTVTDLKRDRELAKQRELAKETEVMNNRLTAAKDYLEIINADRADAQAELVVIQEEVTKEKEELVVTQQQVAQAKQFLNQIPDWPAYNEEATRAFNIIDAFRRLLQETFGRGGIFRNRKAEKTILNAVESLRDMIMVSVSALRGYEIRESVPEPQQRSKVIVRSFEDTLADAVARSGSRSIPETTLDKEHYLE